MVPGEVQGPNKTTKVTLQPPLTGTLHVCNDVAVDGRVQAGDSAVEVRLPRIAREAHVGLERDGRVDELPDRAAVVARVRLGRLLQVSIVTDGDGGGGGGIQCLMSCSILRAGLDACRRVQSNLGS